MATDLRWSIGAGLRLAFSSAADGDMREPARRSAFLAAIGCDRRCVAPRQIHGALVVDAGDAARLDAADGIATTDPGLALAVFGADCPGLCLAADDALVVAHCGWRGTAAGIVAAAIAAIAARSRQPPREWRAFIGPGISGRRYQVDGPVLAARAWPAAALTPDGEGRARLDLAAAIESDLRDGGVAAVSSAGLCTCDDHRLWSYRRCGAGPVQALVAWRDDGWDSMPVTGPGISQI